MQLRFQPAKCEVLTTVRQKELASIEGGLSATLFPQVNSVDQVIYRYDGCFKLDLRLEPVAR